MSPTLPPWRPLLKAACQREGRSVSARWLQLATVSADGKPRVRTLVCRGWADADQLDLFSDGRSSKINDLHHQPAAELCWLFPKARQQYRLRGTMRLITTHDDPQACQAAWEGLTATGRAVWGWPTPEQPLNPAAEFPRELESTTPLPGHFVVLRMQVLGVERLNLGTHPHQRWRWVAETGWREESLNP